MTGTASFGGEDGGVEVGISCIAVLISKSGSSLISSVGGSGTGWDCMSIVRITNLPLERVSEENHELG